MNSIIKDIIKENEIHEVNRSFFKCDYLRYTPEPLNYSDVPKIQVLIDLSRESGAVSLKKTVTELDLEVFVYNAPHDDYKGVDHLIRLVNLAAFALFSECNFSSSS